MSDFNKVILQGKVAKKTELRKTPEGSPVIDFFILSTDKVKRKDKMIKKTILVKVTHGMTKLCTGNKN